MYYVRQLTNGHQSIRYFLHVGKLSSSAAYCWKHFQHSEDGEMFNYYDDRLLTIT